MYFTYPSPRWLHRRSYQNNQLQVSSCWLNIEFLSLKWEQKSNYKTMVLKSPCISRVPRKNTAKLQGETILFSLPSWKWNLHGNNQMQVVGRHSLPGGDTSRHQLHWTAGVDSGCLRNMSSYCLSRWEICTSSCMGFQGLQKWEIAFTLLSEGCALGRDTFH